MGNYRFRLSDMIPNTWFYKLKDMNKPFKNNNTSSQNPNKKKSSPPSTTTTTTTQPQHFSNPRHSYYFTTDPFKAEKLYNSPINQKTSDTHFPEPPRKSSKRSRRPSTKTKTKKTLPPKVVTSTIWPNPVDSTSEHSDHHSPFHSSPDSNFYEFLLRESGSDGGRISGTDPFDSLTSWSSSCSCRISSSTADIIIDMDGKESAFTRKFDRFQLELPPIVTKPAKFSDMVSDIKKKEKFRSSTKLEQRKTTTTTTTTNTNTNTNTNGSSLCVKVVKEQKNTNSSIRKTSVSSPGVKIRSNSPKIASKKIQAYSRKSVSSNTSTSSKTPKKNKNITDSFAIVKSSFDPQRDFRESMVEMIVENNIRASKDLEELLACYLTLNSNEYHDLIVKVFEQIWFDLTNFRL